ncbi:MAG TPA: serine/threonine-protein kinase [Bryobacteraceae bacterium]|nr:serine/threonine-protein kinase [Bryobacteraceae bacterium]
MERQELVKASSAASHGEGEGSTFHLSPAMAERAAGRLCWVSMACALTAGVTFALHQMLQPEVRARQDDPVFALNLVAVLLFAAGLVAVQRLRVLPAVNVLHLGLVFEILVAWCISYAETFLPIKANEVVRGGSMVAVWIAFVLMLVRHTPLTTLLVATLAACTWPAAYFFNVWLHGYETAPWNRLVLWMFTPFMTAFWAYFLTKRIFHIEMQAQKAEELGSYKLAYLLGEGGMGEVWRARHRMLARDAAIKIIRGDTTGRGSARQAEVLRKRFEREAKATARLECPHTVYIFDFGTTRQGSFYYVMELLNGISLQTMVERFGPQPASRVVHFLKETCLSLEEAHRKGLVHRDIKPTNIFSCRVGLETDFTKVLDFGLVKHTDGGETTMLTQDGSSAGTPAYMAPEAAMGEEKVDGRLDIYSLGCVAYYLLTGQLVFEENNSTAMALAHVQKEPVAPSLRTELPVPACLDEIVLKCLAKKPEDRPLSASALIRMLDACTDVEPWTHQASHEWWLAHLPENLAGAPAFPSDGSGETIDVG